MDLKLTKDYTCHLDNVEKSFKKGDILSNATPEAINLLLYRADGGKGVAEVHVERKAVAKNPNPIEEPKKETVIPEQTATPEKPEKKKGGRKTSPKKG